MILDAGCGCTLGTKRRKGIGVDLHRGSCDIIADIEQLPFRSGSFAFIFARNVLEHLSDPVRCLRELERVMVVGASLSITIPIHHNAKIDELLKFVLGFPFQTYTTLKRLYFWKQCGALRGAAHRNRIEARDIAAVFTVDRVFPIYEVHAWFKGRKGRFLQRLGFRPFSPTPTITYIHATKRQT